MCSYLLLPNPLVSATNNRTAAVDSMSDQMKNGVSSGSSRLCLSSLMDSPMVTKLATRASLGCHGETADIANFVSFIVSDQAKFITGTYSKPCVVSPIPASLMNVFSGQSVSIAWINTR